MTSASLINDRQSPETAGERVRLKLKPKSPSATGFVDGGWWPRSRDLAAELPALVAVLAVRLGQVERVGYQLSDWDPAERLITVDGGLVHMDGYRLRPAGTLDLASRTQRVTLLVVPPDTDAQLAHRALVVAGHRDNTDPVAELIASPRVSAGVDADAPS